MNVSEGVKYSGMTKCIKIFREGLVEKHRHFYCLVIMQLSFAFGLILFVFLFQMKAHCRPRGRPRLLSTKFKQKACSQLKQKAKAKHGSRLVNLLCHRETNKPSTITEHLSREHCGKEEHTHCNKTGEHSDTGKHNTC